MSSTKRRATTILRVFEAAIVKVHIGFNRVSARSHPLVKRILQGARRINPPARRPTPTWESQVVLDRLLAPPFEPLDRIDMNRLSHKTAFLLALASAHFLFTLCACRSRIGMV